MQKILKCEQYSKDDAFHGYYQYYKTLRTDSSSLP